MDYDVDVTIRHDLVEGVGPWTWPMEDTGAWTGPSEEFATIRDTILRFVRKRDVIVQAGGCCGMYPRLFSEVFQEVYTFEPAPLNWYCLVRNCPDERIHKYNAALGDLETEVYLNIFNYYNVGMNTIRQEQDGGNMVPVQQLTIDGLNLAACDAIQLDVENYEGAALIGAERTIARYRPVISIETKPDSDMSATLLRMWNYVKRGTLRADDVYVPAEFS